MEYTLKFGETDISRECKDDADFVRWLTVAGILTLTAEGFSVPHDFEVAPGLS